MSTTGLNGLSRPLTSDAYRVTAASGARDASTSRLSPAAGIASESTVVTLSPEAQALARFAAKGITVTQGTLGGISKSASDPTKDAAISTPEFNQLMDQLGASGTPASQLKGGLDSDGDGSISSEELLKGLANTLDDPASPTSQALLSLMDRNRDGSVSQREFVKMETAFVDSGKSIS